MKIETQFDPDQTVYWVEMPCKPCPSCGRTVYFDFYDVRQGVVYSITQSVGALSYQIGSAVKKPDDLYATYEEARTEAVRRNAERWNEERGEEK